MWENCRHKHGEEGEDKNDIIAGKRIFCKIITSNWLELICQHCKTNAFL